MKIIDNVRLYAPRKTYNSEQLYHLELREGYITSINKGRVREANGQVIDGQGSVLMSSFNDSHIHLLRYGLMKDELDLRRADSWQEVLRLIKDDEAKKQLKEGDWLVARGLIINMMI